MLPFSRALSTMLLSLSVLSLSAQQSPAPAKPEQPKAEKTQSDKSAEQLAAQDRETLAHLNSAFEALVAKVSPAVVQILVNGYGPLDHNGRNETALIARQHAIGSGVIVDSDGYIMTNAHVVEGAQRIRVVLSTVSSDPSQVAPIGKQRVLDAKLIGVHKESDLALLKVDTTGLPTLAFGAGRRVRQGQLVFAIGSPEGLEDTATMGVISSVSRQPDPDSPMVFLQTDAPINPGNSGGPLIDIDGFVVGINTLIFSQGGGSEGLGFAIPSRVVKFVYRSLRKYGHVHRVEVKAGAQTITPDLADALGLPRSWGVVIDDVTPGGPADSAGLKIGDIVLSADDRVIDTLPAFTAALYLHPLDEVLKLVVLRGDQRETLHIPVLEMTDQMDAIVSLANSEANVISKLGILGLDLTNEQLRSAVGTLRRDSGVVVVARTAQISGPVTGLTTGDVIYAVNRHLIGSLDSLHRAVAELKPGDSVALQIEREGKLQWLTFEME